LALYSNFAPLFPSPRVGEMCRPVLVASVVTVALLELASASLRGSGNHSVVGNMTSMQGQDLVCPTWLSPHFAEALPYYDKQPKFGTYSCSGMVTAAAKYGIKFDDSDASKVEAAAFIANVGHETVGLQYLEEIQKQPYCSPCTTGAFCQCDSCKCVSGQEYFGRGPLQLSWNYNYHSFQIDERNPVSVDLVAQPSELLANPARGWESAMWFWTSKRAGQDQDLTIHEILAGDASNFGKTIARINEIECGDAWNTGATKGEGMDRVQRFRDLLAKLNVPIPDVVASWSAENPACKPPPQCFCPAPHSTWSCNPDKPSKWMCGATSPWAQCVCH